MKGRVDHNLKDHLQQIVLVAGSLAQLAEHGCAKPRVVGLNMAELGFPFI